ncbi:MAG: prephenate dehydrogenase/arogenate dehydrogenase family protein [Hydrotalea sp.]|nr:prephenate dehydrogenase/arogenate dehydrogenase family protein [Hydrotalea sp.]
MQQTTPLFNKITLVGVGLIGSSLGRAIIYKKLAREVVGLEQNENLVARVMATKCVTSATTKVDEAIKNTDLVILCVPMGQYDRVMADITPAMASEKRDIILSDVGSVKGSAVAVMEKYINGTKNIKLIPAHPIAGTEFSGPESGMAHLFQDMFCIITPPDGSDKTAYDKVVALWSSIGAQVQQMTVQHHDEVLAITSHLPHLIAYTITGTARTFENNIKNVNSQEVIKYSAGGWRDFTRIAASDPVMWRDIFLNNKDAVMKQLEHFKQDLNKLTTAMADNDGATLENWFADTKTIRQALPSVSQQVDEQKQKEKFYDAK